MTLAPFPPRIDERRPVVSAAHLLIVDDDERMRGLLQKYLIKQGFLVTAAPDAARARRLVSGLAFDMVVLDAMMHAEGGIDFLVGLRRESAVPVIVLSANAQLREPALEAGADDFLVKPFEPRELVQRIKAVLRLEAPQGPGPITPRLMALGRLRYDMESGELHENGQQVRLTQTEAALMRALAAHQGEVLSREALVDLLVRDRGGAEMAQARAIDVQITRLRRKIEPDPKRPRFLQTVRGEGYRLTGG